VTFAEQARGFEVPWISIYFDRLMATGLLFCIFELGSPVISLFILPFGENTGDAEYRLYILHGSIYQIVNMTLFFCLR